MDMTKNYEDTVKELKKNGFEGFYTVKELKIDTTEVPKKKGVYMVLRKSDKEPEYLKIGTGGKFKGEDGNVSIDELKKNWNNNSCILYIGKAGSYTPNKRTGKISKANLSKRIETYMKYGSGEDIGHKGGRYIWQLKDSDELIVCWKETKNEPREEEGKLIKDFKEAHGGKRPFANLRDEIKEDK